MPPWVGSPSMHGLLRHVRAEALGAELATQAGSRALPPKRGRHPGFGLSGEPHALQTGYAYRDEFMFGLELILDGRQAAVSI